MKSAIIVHDHSVTFSLQRGNPEGHHVYQLSMDSLYTPYGFFVGATRAVNECMDLIAGKAIEGKSPAGEVMGALVTIHGDVYRMFRFQKTLVKQKIQVGKGAFCVMSDEADVIMAMSMAMHLTKHDAMKSVELVGKDMLIRPKTYVTYKIADIVKELKKRGAVEPMFVDRFGPAIEEKKE